MSHVRDSHRYNIAAGAVTQELSVVAAQGAVVAYANDNRGDAATIPIIAAPSLRTGRSIGRIPVTQHRMRPCVGRDDSGISVGCARVALAAWICLRSLAPEINPHPVEQAHAWKTD